MSDKWAAGFGDGKWEAVHEDAYSSGFAPIVDSRGNVVAMALTVGQNDNDAIRRDRIIQAVNSHQDLIDALREANAFILAPAEDLKDGVLSRIRAAITKATA